MSAQKKESGKQAVPESETQAPAEGVARENGGNRKQRGGMIHLKSRQSLERLRSRVQEATRELRRLREENERLSERIAALESAPAGSRIGLDEDPEVLEQKIKGFIEAIDRYLESDEKG